MASAIRTRLHGKNLKALNPDLFSRVAAQVDISLTEWKWLDMNSLDEATRDELAATFPVLAKMADPTDDMAANAAMNKADLDAGARQAKVQRDTTAGLARLKEWAAAGLQDTKENAAAIEDWLNEKTSGYLSVGNIDAAIEFLGPRGSNVLTWKPKVAPPPVVVEPPAVTLPDGSKQLALGTTPQRHHTTAQLRDLSSRIRAKGRTGGNTFGSKF